MRGVGTTSSGDAAGTLLIAGAGLGFGIGLATWSTLLPCVVFLFWLATTILIWPPAVRDYHDRAGLELTSDQSLAENALVAALPPTLHIVVSTYMLTFVLLEAAISSSGVESYLLLYLASCLQTVVYFVWGILALFVQRPLLRNTLVYCFLSSLCGNLLLGIMAPSA